MRQLKSLLAGYGIDLSRLYSGSLLVQDAERRSPHCKPIWLC